MIPKQIQGMSLIGESAVFKPGHFTGRLYGFRPGIFIPVYFWVQALFNWRTRTACCIFSFARWINNTSYFNELGDLATKPKTFCYTVRKGFGKGFVMTGIDCQKGLTFDDCFIIRQNPAFCQRCRCQHLPYLSIKCKISIDECRHGFVTNFRMAIAMAGKAVFGLLIKIWRTRNKSWKSTSKICPEHGVISTDFLNRIASINDALEIMAVTEYPGADYGRGKLVGIVYQPWFAFWNRYGRRSVKWWLKKTY